jgi:hypothetical protein
MALTIKHDDEQWNEIRDHHERMAQAIADLSDNLAKWQAEQTRAIAQGFDNLIRIFGGPIDDRDQAIVDDVTGKLKSVKDKLQTSVDSQTTQTKGD